MLFALESFDSDAPENAPADPTKNKQYQSGYDAGFAAALERFEAEQTTLSANLVQEVADMSFGFAEAQSHIIAQITALLDAVSQVILPAAMTLSLKSQLHELLSEALQHDATRPAVFSVHPAQLKAVQNALSDVDHPFLSVVADPQLSEFAAIGSLPAGETYLDTSEALRLITEIFGNLHVAAERKQS